MKKLVLTVAAVSTLALGACGGDDKDTVSLTPDAMDVGTPDAMITVCNPVTQAGCASGEKCAELIVSAPTMESPNDPFLAQIACVPDGTITENAACMSGAPGEATGYDNCVAGYDCFAGPMGAACLPICNTGPDTCHTTPPAAFGEGANCADNYVDHFNDTTGVCLPACNPTDDTVMAGVATNPACGTGAGENAQGCTLNPITAATSCAGVGPEALEMHQNDKPYGPTPETAFVNGCASGFSATLLDQNIGMDRGLPQCARYCTPENSYKNAAGENVGAKEGTNGNCSSNGLNDIGGTNNFNDGHECRFIQKLFTNTDMVPESVGICMPVKALGGTITLGNGAVGIEKSRALCHEFEWDGFLDMWNTAAPQGQDAIDTAFDAFCLGNDGTTINAKCHGWYFGCTSLAEEAKLMPAAGGGNARTLINKIRSRYQPTLSPLQMEELGL